MLAVLLSIYGNSPYLKTFLASLQSQSMKEFCLIYRFDGDAAPEAEAAVAGFSGAEGLEDRRHYGVVGSYQALIEAAMGFDYVLFADQDDIWHPDKVALTMEKMNEAERESGREMPILVHSDLRVVDETVAEIAPSMMAYQSLRPHCTALKQLMIQNNVTGCTMMGNQALMRLCTLPNEAICHDWYIAMVAAAFGRIVFIGQPLIDYRQHGANVYGAVRPKSLFAALFQRASLHERLALTQHQARAFLRQFEKKLTEDEIKMLAAWSSNLENPHYLSRLFCTMKNGFCKHDWKRTLGLWWAI